MEEGELAIARMLRSQPAEVQRIMWKDMKETFLAAKNPDTQAPFLTSEQTEALRQNPEQTEALWQNIVNIIKSTGYIPPEGVQ